MTLGVLVIFFTGVFFAPVSASELSDAERAHSDLRAEYSQNFELLNAISARESAAQECVAKYADSSVASDVSQRRDCEATLTSLQNERSAIVEREQSAKKRILELEQLIERLRSEAATSGTSSPGGGSYSQSGFTPLIQTEAPKPANELQPSQSSNQSLPATPGNQVETATPIPTPTPSPDTAQKQSSATQVAPTASTKATPSPKSTAKKRTITCVKGKTTRKVTAVKPVCPKGFRIKR